MAYWNINTPMEKHNGLGMFLKVRECSAENKNVPQEVKECSSNSANIINNEQYTKFSDIQLLILFSKIETYNCV